MSPDAGRVVRHLRQLLEGEGLAGLRDDQLLHRFAALRDEAAFAVLVQRHGPLVLGVSRRLLGNPHDADDAFQATFLVLARRAAHIRNAVSLAAWLHAVAVRVARRMRADTTRRRQRELQAPPAKEETPVDPGWRELRGVLDEELSRLSDKHRRAVLLCCLEGLTQEEAAAHLGLPRGTFKRHLEKGRDLLRHRLARRGLTSASILVATTTVGEALATVPGPLGTSTARAAVLFAARQALPAELASTSAVALAEGVLSTMFVTKLKYLAVIVIVLGLGGLSAYLYANHGPEPAVVVAPAPQPQPVRPAGQPPKKDVPDRERFQGVWRVAAMTTEGEVIPAATLEEYRLTVKGDRMTWAFGQLPVPSKFKIDDATDRKHIEIRDDNPAPDNETSFGIYKFEGDKLWVCLAVGPKNRPKEFVSTKTPSTMLFIFEREQAGAEDVFVAKGPEQPVKLSAKLPKGLKLAQVNSEKWRFYVEIENTSKETIVVWPHLAMKVLDDKGNEVKRTRSLGRFGLRTDNKSILEGIRFVTLAPGKSHKIDVGIGFYGSDERMILGWKLPSAGTYTVELTYHYDRARVKKDYGKGAPDIDGANQPWNRALEIERKLEVKLRVAD